MTKPKPRGFFEAEDTAQDQPAQKAAGPTPVEVHVTVHGGERDTLFSGDVISWGHNDAGWLFLVQAVPGEPTQQIQRTWRPGAWENITITTTYDKPVNPR